MCPLHVNEDNEVLIGSVGSFSQPVTDRKRIMTHHVKASLVFEEKAAEKHRTLSTAAAGEIKRRVCPFLPASWAKQTHRHLNDNRLNLLNVTACMRDWISTHVSCYFLSLLPFLPNYCARTRTHTALIPIRAKSEGTTTYKKKNTGVQNSTPEQPIHLDRRSGHKSDLTSPMCRDTPTPDENHRWKKTNSKYATEGGASRQYSKNTIPSTLQCMQLFTRLLPSPSPSPLAKKTAPQHLGTNTIKVSRKVVRSR